MCIGIWLILISLVLSSSGNIRQKQTLNVRYQYYFMHPCVKEMYNFLFMPKQKLFSINHNLITFENQKKNLIFLPNLCKNWCKMSEIYDDLNTYLSICQPHLCTGDEPHNTTHSLYLKLEKCFILEASSLNYRKPPHFFIISQHLCTTFTHPNYDRPPLVLSEWFILGWLESYLRTVQWPQIYVVLVSATSAWG